MPSIDRLCATMPPHVLAEMAATVEVAPIRWAVRVGTRPTMLDQVHVRTTLRLRSSVSPKHHKVLCWITRHPVYAAEVRKRLDALPLKASTPTMRYGEPNKQPKGRQLRDRCMCRRPTTAGELMQLGLQTARGLARNDTTMLTMVERATMTIRPNYPCRTSHR